MNIKNKLKNFYLPINTSSLALFLSVLAIGYVASATNTPCLQAQSTCAIGGDNEFTGNISLKGNTSHSALLKVDPLISGDIELTLPNQTGTLALVGSTLAGSKIVATDINGDLTTNSYLPTGIGTAGQFLKVNPGATALIYADISEVPSLTNNAPYLKVNGAGEIDSSATLTADSPFLSVDGSGQIQAGTSTADAPYVKIDASGQLDSSATLTADSPFLSADASGQIQAGTIGAASTPLKSDANSQIVASDLDITTDITPGSALQEIRVNSGGTALEYFTPSGGSDVTLVASGNVIMNSAFGSLPQTGANICWFTQAGKLDDDKSYRLVVEFDTYSGQLMNTAYQKNAYLNPLFYASSVPDCGDTTNNNNGFNENIWSMTQNMPYQYAPNNVYFSNGYSENSGVTYVDCCIPLYPYGAGQGGITSYVSASNMTMDFSPFQDSVFSSSYKVGFSAQYTVNGYVQTTQLNPTNDIVSAWQIIGNATSLGNVQNGTLQSNDRKFEDFQGLKIGCTSQYCFGGDTTWALYELNR